MTAVFPEPPGLRALSERIERMREEERARLARELHDELGQLLTGIKLDFAAARHRLRELQVPGDVVDRLQSAMGQVDIGIAMVRRIASDLRPAALDHQDLGGALEFEARRVAARAGLRITVWAQITDPVPAESATAVFRIFQEALTNAVRHAGASRVRARLTARHGLLRLYLRDDGVGIPEDRMRTGLGLLGMHERARRLGGGVCVRRARARGTLVAATVPIGQRA
jgi:signal transduction histidine kinase